MENFTSVVIDTPVGASETILAPAVAGEEVRLRRFWGTIAAEGEIQFLATGGTKLSGPIRLVARGGFVEPGDQNPEVCVVTPVGTGLVLRTTAAFGGWCRFSQK